MTITEIRETVADYGAAAANARRAGFDGVEIHALGSFLIPQFLNPRLNRRHDAYGGRPGHVLHRRGGRPCRLSGQWSGAASGG